MSAGVPLGLIEDLELERLLEEDQTSRAADLWRRRKYLESSVARTVATQSRARIEQLEIELATYQEGRAA